MKNAVIASLLILTPITVFLIMSGVRGWRLAGMVAGYAAAGAVLLAVFAGMIAQ